MDPEIRGTSAAKKSIFRAPVKIRYGRRENFEPKWVSIGPYYHGRENLKPMEELKLQCMSDLLSRYRPDFFKKKKLDGGSYTIETPVHEFTKFGEEARLYYHQGVNLAVVDFVRMLFHDSCFIIRIIISLHQSVEESMGFLEVNIKEVRSDLLLLENQIPLFFIKTVYEWFFLRPDNPTFSPFKTVLGPFIRLDMPWRFINGGMSSGAAHLLDLYWRCSSPPNITEQVNNIGRDQEQTSWAEIHIPINAPKVIANATVLHQKAGIKFKKLNYERHDDGRDVKSGRARIHNRPKLVQCLVQFIPSKFPFRFVGMSDDRASNQTRSDAPQNPPSPFEVEFLNGIMRMPCLKIDSSQTTLLLNLIAFESSISPRLGTFSSYMKLMDALIDSEMDVELLQQFGVIRNTLSSHKMAATFFNDIGNFCLIDNNAFLFSNLYDNVQKYYDTIWNRRWASLQNNYFSSPWAGISVFAGVTLLILSALQTFFTIYGYYNPKR